MLCCIRLRRGMRVTITSWPLPDEFVTPQSRDPLSTSQAPRCADLLMISAARQFSAGSMLWACLNPSVQAWYFKGSNYKSEMDACTIAAHASLPLFTTCSCECLTMTVFIFLIICVASLPPTLLRWTKSALSSDITTDDISSHELDLDWNNWGKITHILVSPLNKILSGNLPEYEILFFPLSLKVFCVASLCFKKQRNPLSTKRIRQNLGISQVKLLLFL